MDPIEDQSGIQEILEAEIEQLEQDLQARKVEIETLRKTIKPESVQEELAFDFFTVLEGQGLAVTGVALAEGIWKNVVYSSDEIKKAADQLLGKPIKIEHGQDKEFGDRSVGEVIEAKWDELLKALKFKAKLTDQKAIDYVNAGRFKAVSMSTWMDKIPIGQEGIKMGLDYKFAELSLVENPACDRCFIFHCEKLSKMEKDLKGVKKETIVGELKMEKEENSSANLEISEEELSERKQIVLAWVEENGELELIELSSEEELEKLKKERKVYGYYYGYPHLYAYSPYGYYPYKYKYKKYQYKYPKAEGQNMEDPFEEMEDSIVCKACDAKFSNFKDFIKHWAKDHMIKYGKYESAPEYKEYQSEDNPDELGLKVVFNKISKKWTVFDVPEKGLWKIKKVFDSEDEAKKFVAGGGKLSEDVVAPTTIVCPVCGEKFTDEVAFNKHWMDTHLMKYGEYKPKPDQSPEYGMPPGGTVNQNLKEGKEIMSEKKEEPKVAEVKEEPKVEAPKVEPKVEVPKVEPPKEEPKVEIPKAEVPKEEPKVEPKLEQKPIEIPIVIVPSIRELPKEEPKVEAPKVETPKVEEAPIVEPPKEVAMTEEQLLLALKEHPEAKRIILEKWFDSKRSKQ